jgi:hypothetical protein
MRAMDGEQMRTMWSETVQYKNNLIPLHNFSKLTAERLKMNTNDLMIFNLESQTPEARLRRGIRAVDSTKDPEYFWQCVPDSPRPDKYRNAAEKEKINQLFYTWEDQRDNDESFQDATSYSRNLWMVEEWIFGIALLKCHNLDCTGKATIASIVEKIGWCGKNEFDWALWQQQQHG